MKRLFKFSGYDNWDRPVYEGEDGTLLVDEVESFPHNLTQEEQDCYYPTSKM